MRELSAAGERPGAESLMAVPLSRVEMKDGGALPGCGAGRGGEDEAGGGAEPALVHRCRGGGGLETDRFRGLYGGS